MPLSRSLVRYNLLSEGAQNNAGTTEAGYERRYQDQQQMDERRFDSPSQKHCRDLELMMEAAAGSSDHHVKPDTSLALIGGSLIYICDMHLEVISLLHASEVEAVEDLCTSSGNR